MYMPGEASTFVATLSAWIRDRITVGTHADMRMAIALALTEEVLGTARDLRASIEPGTRARAPFFSMWKDRLETEQRHRASYIRAVD